MSVVMMTRNRRERVLATMAHLGPAASDGVEVIVVDNGSTDGTPEAVRQRWPDVRVIALRRNAGAVARNIGVDASQAEVVAFADDDSWWAPGALERALEHFRAHPRLAVLAARVLVGPDERLDPVCAEMALSPLPPAPDLPGPRILGFVACGAVVRRAAFRAVGGFDGVIRFAGEEERLAIDLAVAGWGMAYVPDVVAHHHPGTAGRRLGRDRLAARNSILTACMRRPWRVAGARLGHAPARAILMAALRAPVAVARRRPVPPTVEAELRLLEEPRARLTRRSAVTPRPAAAPTGAGSPPRRVGAPLGVTGAPTARRAPRR
jgi:GT2 family glycosyltransferase